MKTGNNVEDFKEEFLHSVATIGNFDGLHIGHRHIVSAVKERAKELRCHSLLITFEPHPSSVLYPSRGLLRLTSPEKKEAIVKECRLDGMLTIPFTLEFANKGPRAFVEDVLHPLKLKELYVGHDFSFGSGRSGNVKSLTKEGELMSFGVFEIKEVMKNGEPVRSSGIRKSIAGGDVAKAADMLLRYHSLRGKVIKGAGRGKTLHFPTANLGEMQEIVPEAGIYATKTCWNKKLYDSATHIGVIPTFDVDIPGIETHILGFHKEITGDDIEVFFIKKMRDTKRFDSPKELEEQIKTDCAKIVRVLKDETKENYLPR